MDLTPDEDIKLRNFGPAGVFLLNRLLSVNVLNQKAEIPP